MLHLKSTVLASAALCVASLAAKADVIDLTFENQIAESLVQDYYNGGTNSAGQSGPNYGVSFTSTATALPLNTLSNPGVSNTSRGGLGDPNSQNGALYIPNSTATFANIAAGFTTGFSFNYSSPFFNGTVSVFSGLNGTGSLLATIDLPITSDGLTACPGFGADYCPFVAAGVTFTGTAQSISFGGTENRIVFDDITFGSSVPGTVPLPASAPMFGAALLGLAGVGYAAKRKKAAAAT